MSLPKWARRWLTEEDVKAVSDAVKDAEGYTSGEIVPVVISHSSYIGQCSQILVLMWITLFAAFVFSGWIYADWVHFPSITFGVLILGAAAAWVLGRNSFVRRILIGKPDLNAQALRRAQLEFYHEKVTDTFKSTGVLIFVSLMEHKVIVLADKGIAQKVKPEVWNEVVAIVVGGIRSQSLAQGLCAGIRRVGKILSEHFPPDADDKNELSNRLRLRSE
jgi:putative membrane protein